MHLLLVSISLSQEIAREHYCNILSFASAKFVHNYMDNDIDNTGLTGLADCGVNYYQSDEIFTPDELLISLKAWYTRTVSNPSFVPRPSQLFNATFHFSARRIEKPGHDAKILFSSQHCIHY